MMKDIEAVDITKNTGKGIVVTTVVTMAAITVRIAGPEG
jgi:hypothetical protein